MDLNKIGKNRQELITAFVFIWFTAVMPLYYKDGYFNILQAKGNAFGLGCLIAIVLILVFSIRDLSPERSLTDAGQMILAASALISCVLSGDFFTAFAGYEGWCVGGFALLAGALIYLWLSRNGEVGKGLWYLFMAVNAFVFVLGICHSMAIDILGIHEGIAEKQYFWYIATIGNINWYSGYLCLIMPLMAVRFMGSDERTESAVLLIFLILGEINMVLTESDSLYLGIGFFAFFCIPYIASEKKRLERASLIVAVYGLALGAVGMLPAFSYKASDIHGLSGAFLKPYAFIPVIALGITSYAFFSLRKDGGWKPGRTLTIVLEGILACAALYFFIDMIRNFGPSWGTNRGRTWIYSMELFGSFPIVKKLFGVGPEMLAPYFEKLSEQFTRRIIAAHSEPLQILLTSGLAGLTGWILTWAGVFTEFFRKKVLRSKCFGYFGGLAAFFGQSLVNTPMTTNYGLCILFLGIYIYNLRKIEN